MLDYTADHGMGILDKMGIIFNPEEEELVRMEWEKVYSPEENIMEVLKYFYCEEIPACSELSDKYFGKIRENRTKFFNSRAKELDEELSILLKLDPNKTQYN